MRAIAEATAQNIKNNEGTASRNNDLKKTTNIKYTILYNIRLSVARFHGSKIIWHYILKLAQLKTGYEHNY